jgi:hypothetical protein
MNRNIQTFILYLRERLFSMLTDVSALPQVNRYPPLDGEGIAGSEM